jgi:primosomal protein N' (replication factor Y)
MPHHSRGFKDPKQQSSEQGWLFEVAPPPWEGDAAEEPLAEVVFPSGPEGEWTYLVPARLAGQVEPGRRVLAPMGRGDRLLIGYCVRVEYAVPRGKLKSIRQVLDEVPLVPPKLLALTRWLADRYLCPWAQVLETVVPSAVRQRAGTRLTTLLSVPPDVSARLNDLKLPAAQTRVLRLLAQCPQPLTPRQLAFEAGCTQAPISQLRRKGLIRTEHRRLSRFEPQEVPSPPDAPHALNQYQQAALDLIRQAIQQRRHEVILLHGITGSGKTEVYIRAIEEVISFGQQAIVLVPEISLTPQTRQRFRARFGHVAVLHSHLNDAERHWQWNRIARGEVHVVVGARSAVFAPTPRLGMIVVDEEHEGSFKQATAPRYHARDVALARAQSEQVPVVLGSATPSLESWYRALQGEYRLAELPARVLDRPLPEVRVIDQRTQLGSAARHGPLSRALDEAMRQVLREGGQVMLLLNRRGYATHLQCPYCAHVVRCPACDIALVHHRQQHAALCHYCEHSQPPPDVCPECGKPGIRYSGLGTQRLEHEVQTRFPEYPVLRMDRDTMQGPGSHERALDAFRAGDKRILLGTQMIAKGLDFPDVTLVGVVNADVALHLPDFRATERTFQLLVQVAGRTGRGDRGGCVLIQTLSPDHVAIQAALRHDYELFARRELANRREFNYPPFSSQIRVVIRGPREAATRATAEELASHIRAALGIPPGSMQPGQRAASQAEKQTTPAGQAATPAPENGREAQQGLASPCSPEAAGGPEREAATRVLGPAPAPLARLRGLYRFHLLIQGPQLEPLAAAVRQATASVSTPEHVQWIVDVDPLDML